MHIDQLQRASYLQYEINRLKDILADKFRFYENKPGRIAVCFDGSSASQHYGGFCIGLNSTRMHGVVESEINDLKKELQQLGVTLD